MDAQVHCYADRRRPSHWSWWAGELALILVLSTIPVARSQAQDREPRSAGQVLAVMTAGVASSSFLITSFKNRWCLRPALTEQDRQGLRSAGATEELLRVMDQQMCASGPTPPAATPPSPAVPAPPILERIQFSGLDSVLQVNQFGALSIRGLTASRDELPLRDRRFTIKCTVREASAGVLTLWYQDGDTCVFKAQRAGSADVAVEVRDSTAPGRPLQQQQPVRVSALPAPATPTPAAMPNPTQPPSSARVPSADEVAAAWSKQVAVPALKDRYVPHWTGLPSIANVRDLRLEDVTVYLDRDKVSFSGSVVVTYRASAIARDAKKKIPVSGLIRIEQSWLKFDDLQYQK